MKQVQITPLKELKKLPPEEYIENLEQIVSHLENEGMEFCQNGLAELARVIGKMESLTDIKGAATDIDENLDLMKTKGIDLLATLDEYRHAIIELTDVKPMFKVKENYSRGLLMVLRENGVYRTWIDLNENSIALPVKLSDNSKDFPAKELEVELKREYETGDKNVWAVTNPSKLPSEKVLAHYAAEKIMEKYLDTHEIDEGTSLPFGISLGAIPLGHNVSLHAVPVTLKQMVKMQGPDYYKKKCPGCEDKDTCMQYKIAKKEYNLQ